MWSVEHPCLAPSEIVAGGAKRVRNRDLARRLTAAVPYLVTNELLLEALVLRGSVHEASQEDFELDTVTDDELRWFYLRHMSDSGGGSRKQYERILAGARYGLCSYCQYGQATTLDHVVPQTKVGGLAITALNLVPACQQCNKKLLDWQPGTGADQMIHPYLEAVESRWLYAQVIEDGPGGLRFRADPSVDLDPALRARVVAQFELLGLELLFAGVSGRDLAEARSVVRGQDAGASGVEDARRQTTRSAIEVAQILMEEANRSFAVDTNSRRGAAYEALAQSEWFCAQGASRR